jgi:hypothetical protein
MKKETPPSEGDAAETPRARPFKKFNPARLAPELAARQGRITTAAFLALGRDAAIEFLNTPDPETGGRPLDLAMESADGERLVAEMITQAAAGRAGGKG